MKTEDFLDILEQRQLVSKEIIGKLRAKTRQSDKRITAKSVLKYLVKKDLVTREQAQQLLATTLPVDDKAESSILGMVPIPLPPRPDEEPAAPLVADEPPQASADHASPAPSGLLSEALAAEPGPGSLNDDLAGAAPASRKKGRAKKKVRQNEWDSPLLLLGGGGLVLLLIGGGLIYYLLVRENSDAVLKEATDFFAGGSYSQAARSYEHFVETWPSHPEHSRASVRLGMTRIWIAVESGDYSSALESSRKALESIEDEEAFLEDRESKAELSSLLTRIAEGLADAAEQSDDPEVVRQKVDQAKETISLTGNTKYVPSSLQLKDRLQVVRETLTRVEQQQQRNVDLAETIGQMDQAIADDRIADAYAAYQTLAKQYPALKANPRLAAKVREIATAEQATVQFVEQRQAALAEGGDSPVEGSLALAQRSGTAGPDQGVAMVSAEGALFGVDVETGKPLWRRPLQLPGGAWPLLEDDRVYAPDARNGELVCLDRDTGNLRWRQPLDDQLATPVPHGEQLLLAGARGAMYVVDKADGTLRGSVQFSQPLPTAPAVHARSNTIYVVGNHSSLYTLSADDYSCQGVYYLGHAPQSILAPPAVVFNKVVVAHNRGASTSRLLALSVDDQQVVVDVAAERRLDGLVAAPLAVDGRRVAVATSSGQAGVYEIGAGEGEAGLADVAKHQGQVERPVAHFAWMGDGHLWMAGQELTKFAVLPSGNRLPVRSLDRDYADGVFNQPLQVIGETLVHVRRVEGEAGLVVGAVQRSQGTAIWETRLAVPLAGPPAVDASNRRVTATDALGFVYHVEPSAFDRGVADQPIDLPRRPQSLLTTSIDLGAGRQAASGSGGELLVHYNPALSNVGGHAVALPGRLACELISWGDATVAAADAGPVLVLDPDGAEKRATSFLPEIAPGQRYAWLAPATIGTPDEGALFLCDPAQQLYRVELVEAPRPHLVAVAVADVGSEQFSTRLAIVGEHLHVGNDAGQLIRFRTEDLEPADPVDLGSPIVWGPYRAGDLLLSALANDELTAVDAAGQIRWRQPIERGTLAGAPLVDGAGALITYRRSGVARISLADGKETGYATIAEPLATGPVMFGSQCLVAAADGALLLVATPTE